MKLLIRGEKTLEEIARMSIDLLKVIHSKEIQSDILPDMKTVALGDTKLDPTGEMPEGLVRFLEETGALGL